MITIVHYIIFIGFSVFAFLKALFYAIYEIKTENNKMGGFLVIGFSAISVLVANFALFLHR